MKKYVVKKVKKSAILRALKNEKLVQQEYFGQPYSKKCTGAVCAVGAILRVASFETEYRKRGLDPNDIEANLVGGRKRLSRLVGVFDGAIGLDEARERAIAFVKAKSFPEVLVLKVPAEVLEG